jgi:hypothetical protein
MRPLALRKCTRFLLPVNEPGAPDFVDLVPVSRDTRGAPGPDGQAADFLTFHRKTSRLSQFPHG